MKNAAFILAIAAALASTCTLSAADEKAASKAKPYPLKTCIVADEALGGDHGEPYTFVYKGQEIKLCCKSCLKDFNKEPAKYLKKIEAGGKK